VVSNTRYNGRGYDCRLELHGSTDSVVAGWDASVPVRNLTPGETFPNGAPYQFFMDRFIDAYRAELNAFLDVATGRRASPCTPQEALEVALDRRGRHAVAAATPTDQNGRGTIMNRIAGAPIRGVTGEVDRLRIWSGTSKAAYSW